jgi:hypothetical protein
MLGVFLVMSPAITTAQISEQALKAASHQGFLGGPWELIVRMKGMGGHALQFPITLADENKPQALEHVLETQGAPIQLKLVHYLPDLGWDYAPQKLPDAGVVFQLQVEGKNVNRTVWLSTSDTARTSISSSGGGLKVKRIQDPNSAEAIIRQVSKPDVIGLLTVTPPDSRKALDYPITAAQKIFLPQTKIEVEVLQYVPHYSMDTKTRKVVSRSPMPVNPAIQVRIKQDAKAYEKWLWSRFPSFSHSTNPNDPAAKSRTVGLEFTHVDLSGPNPTRTILCDVSGKAWILLPSASQKVKVEKLSLARSYPFGKQYQCKVEQMIPHALLARKWKNNSETLLRPAIVVQVEDKNKKQDIVLELGKPQQLKTGMATMEYVFRRQKDDALPGNHPPLQPMPPAHPPMKR